LDRYASVYNNPLIYTDLTGHNPVLIVIGVVLILAKVIDYGWTALDVIESSKVISDPNATDQEKSQATGNIAMAVSLEAAEPDDLIPIALPLDDLVRKGIIKLGQETGEETAELALKAFTSRNFRDNLITLTGKSADDAVGMQAHHVFPQKFRDEFNDLGINVDDPHFGAWVDSTHQNWSPEYNERWAEFLQTDPSVEEVFQFAKDLAEEYGFEIYFDVR
jgi:hypothetical protein